MTTGSYRCLWIFPLVDDCRESKSSLVLVKGMPTDSENRQILSTQCHDEQPAPDAFARFRLSPLILALHSMSSTHRLDKVLDSSLSTGSRAPNKRSRPGSIPRTCRSPSFSVVTGLTTHDSAIQQDRDINLMDPWIQTDWIHLCDEFDPSSLLLDFS